MSSFQARHTSMPRLLIFSAAAWLTFRYLLFMLNPLHAGVWWFYLYTVIAEFLVLSNLLYLWCSALHFEMLKSFYYRWVSDQQERGKDLINEQVDVLVPVAGEALNVVEKTLLSCTKLIGHKRVIVLDDSKRPQLQELAEKLHVTYESREDREFFKSGNLNFGLSKVTAPFIAVFDADFCPNPRFLQHTLPLFHQKQVGIVQTPQLYYNEDTFISRGSQLVQQLFYRYIQPSKFLQQSAFCVGTNVVYRTAALKAIGGFYNINHSEDIYTSLRMLEHSPQYQTVYLSTPLASGLTPESLSGLFNQQYRWALGGFSMLFWHNPLFNSKLRLDQRLQYFATAWFYTSGIGLMMYLGSTLIGLLTQAQPVDPAFANQWFAAYLPMMMVNIFAMIYVLRKRFLASFSTTLYYIIPYTVAFFSALFDRKVQWRPTNAAIRSIISQSLWPFIAYLFVGIGILVLYLQQILPWNSSLLVFAGWGIANWLLVFSLVFNAYRPVRT